MRGSGSGNAPGSGGADGGLVGRDAELARLRGLVDPPPAMSRVLVLLGEAGMGKTMLLSAVATSAAESGMTVLPVSGRESERDLAFAGLHQLLRPVLGRVSDLPRRQARALLSAFALSDDPVPADPLLTGMAVLTLLGAVADSGPLLVVADDTQWLDDGSLAALAFAARRLDAERLTLLAAVRGSGPPGALDRGFAELTLPPLSDTGAGRLLDAQPHPPRGRARKQVLAEAAGNPMALVELSRVIAADPAAGRRWSAEPLRPPDRLAAIAAAQFGLLPAETREALLLAAVADTTDLMSVVPANAAALAPAEAAGLIRVDTAGPQFPHPLVRSAIYHAVPFAERAAAHRRIAEAVRAQPDRYAWHLAAAALAPDEEVAALLEETAVQAQRRGGMMAAGRALERAAELSPDTGDQARRLIAAMGLAEWADQSDWLLDLAGRVLAVSADPVQRILARSFVGWALVWSNRHADALAILLSVAEEASQAGLPAAAWRVVALAANVAYQTGAPGDREAVLSALARLEEPGQTPEGQPEGTDELRLWVHGCLEPFTRRTRAVAWLRQVAAGPVADIPLLGAAAWMLDESELAVTLLREALRRLRSNGSPGGSGAMLSAIGWAFVDSGRWDEALAAASEASDAADVSAMPTVAASADLTAATVLALRGAHHEVPPYLDRALAAVNPAEYRGFAARAWHAAGLAALGQGRHDAAYAQLSQLFDTDGRAVHHHVSYLALADLAAAAVRVYRGPETSLLLERALDQADPGPRLEQIAARARCLLGESAGPGETEARFAAALSGPAGDAWPFERAQLRLDYGEWLRRQRRINDAKPVLAAALEVFRRLGADPWTQRTQAELRACGVTAVTAPGPQSTLDGLTAQQREIVILAGRGLTNNEIADRLFLSARTVASHLHRAYGKLGLTGRHQLRNLLDEAGEPPR